MSFPATVLSISAGAIVWTLHFAALYGFTALACARGAGHAVPWMIAAATIAAAGAAAVIVAAGYRGRGEFTAWMSAAVAALALLAILFEGLSALFVPACV